LIYPGSDENKNENNIRTKEKRRFEGGGGYEEIFRRKSDDRFSKSVGVSCLKRKCKGVLEIDNPILLP
jgi:hypothetical protein